MKNVMIAVLGLLVIALVALLLLRAPSTTVVNEPSDDTPIPVEPDNGIGDGAQPLDELVAEEEAGDTGPEVIGQTETGTAIEVHQFGTGNKEVLFIGGIHSAFAPSTVTIAEELLESLTVGDIAVPAGLTVSVITNLNPDASGSSNTLAGRLNDNGVDLNRNFDCEWQPEGTWRSQTVSGGEAAFSEAESRALRDYVQSNDREIVGAVAYYAAGGGVFASSCRNGVSDVTTELTNIYAAAAGYEAAESFDFYEVTGDMVNWLAKENVPAISILLSDYERVNWNVNKAGVEAILEHITE